MTAGINNLAACAATGISQQVAAADELGAQFGLRAVEESRSTGGAAAPGTIAPAGQPITIRQITAIGEYPGHHYLGAQIIHAAYSETNDLLFAIDSSKGLVVYQPASASPISEIALSGHPEWVCLHRNLALVAGFDGTMSIVDIANPRNPRLISQYKSPEGSYGWERIFAVGTTVYLSGVVSNTRKIDITDPAHPVDAGEIPDSVGGFNIYGPFGFCTGNDKGLTIYDARGSSPTVLSRCLTDREHPMIWGLDVDMKRSIAYVACGKNGLAGVGFADPQHPIELFRLELPGCHTKNVTVYNGMALVSAVIGGMYIVDVRDPRQPYIMGHYPSGGDVWSTALSFRSQLIHLCCCRGGIESVSIDENQGYKLCGQFGGVNTFATCKYDDLHILSADGHAGVSVLHVGDQQHPQLVSRLADINARCIVALGTHVIVGADDGLVVCDFSDITHPKIVKRYTNLGGKVMGICVDSEDNLYVAAAQRGLLRFCIGREMHLTLREQRTLVNQYATGVAFHQDGFVLVADMNRGLDRYVLSSVPQKLVYVDNYHSEQGYPQGLAIKGNLVFLAESGLGATIVLAAKNEPLRQIGIIHNNRGEFDGHASGICIDWPLVHISNGQRGVYSANVSDPEHPRVVAQYLPAENPDGNGWASAACVDAAGDLVVANGGRGVLLLERPARH